MSEGSLLSFISNKVTMPQDPHPTEPAPPRAPPGRKAPR